MIENYRFGQITIDGRTYTDDVIIYPDRVDGGWWRKQGHSLCTDDLADVVAFGPDVLVIGTGASGRMQVPDPVRRALSGQGIEPRVATTREACDIYNDLADEQNAVAALHLTC